MPIFPAKEPVSQTEAVGKPVIVVAPDMNPDPVTVAPAPGPDAYPKRGVET